jgi:dolichol-phosphate mannosyltransferase
MTAEHQASAVEAAPTLSVVVPVRDEAPNILMLIEEIIAANPSSDPYEIIYVDDGSADATATILADAARKYPRVRFVRHSRSLGQSAAIRTGVLAARGKIIATLDGDGQNNPVYLAMLVSTLTAGGPGLGLVAGQRVRRRGLFKQMQSAVANAVRRTLLRDGTRDTGCGLKAFHRETYLLLPYFDALHRFMPALMKREGYSIAHIEVVDRQRQAGKSKYGVMNRLWIGIIDLIGVFWLLRRCSRPARYGEVTSDDC